MYGNAIAVTGGLLNNIHAKTTHGLMRGSERFNLVGVVDEKFAGADAGVIVNGTPNGIPVYGSIREFKEKSNEPAMYCILGVATKGGVIPDSLREIIREGISEGFNIVNGLHHFVSDIPELNTLASMMKVELLDIRKPRPKSEWQFWSGKIREVTTPRVAVLGTDCAVGKRTTAWLLAEDLRSRGKKAEMIYTGQTGWMMGARYGFIFDATINDFISGEIEHAIHTCFVEANPDVMLIEGQSSLRNPSGPCGAEFLISGEARYTILQHHAGREKFNGFPQIENSIPDLKDEIELIRIYGSETIAVALNTSGISIEEAGEWQRRYEDELGIPVILPMVEGVNRLTDVLIKIIG